MSHHETHDPDCIDCATTEGVATILRGKPRDIDGFTVARLLPSMARRLVGPFCFFDHMGPAELAKGRALDVRPHPHIGLSTVTYVLSGEVTHKDSLGNDQVIRPLAINWMTAGRGIVHSERTPAELRDTGMLMHLVQLWVALPKEHEETEPSFHHYPASTMPELEVDGARIRVLAGSAYGVTSPLSTHSELFYVDATIPAGGSLAMPKEHVERAAYVLEGSVTAGEEKAEARAMLVFTSGGAPRLHAETAARVLLLGGAPLDGPRYLDWNFVSSSKERIEVAKQQWKNGEFPRVPGDDVEFIPLPER